jgi:drug/metabolite transporter (DMT)-like permease
VNVGVSPFVLALHRYFWPGLALVPFVAANGFRDLGGIGWGRGFVLALFGGLPLALLSYLGYVYVPLGHGAVIQPSCAALGGMILARLVLKEPLPARRIAGGLAIVAGLCIIGAEALRTIGAHGIGGDLLFVAAGGFFATFGMLVRLWRVPAMRSVAPPPPTCSLGRSCSSAPRAPFCSRRWYRHSYCCSALSRSARCRPSRNSPASSLSLLVFD